MIKVIKFSIKIYKILIFNYLIIYQHKKVNKFFKYFKIKDRLKIYSETNTQKLFPLDFSPCFIKLALYFR